MTHALATDAHSIHRHSRSFSLASRLLPEAAREPAHAIYAWCRRADDFIDHAPAGAAPARVQALREELSAIYDGTPQFEPTLAAFQRVVFAFHIPEHYPLELLRGMQMDASHEPYVTLEGLLEYCYCVASTVGLMMCHVMGVAGPMALRHAAHLGLAMQLTNICRDVREDFERGRLYLPRDLLTAAHASLRVPRPPALGAAGDAPRLLLDSREVELDAATVARSGAMATNEEGSSLTALRADAQGVAEATRSLLDVAERYYQSGDAGLIYLEPRCRLAISAARRIYSAIGDVLRARGCDALGPRAVVSTGRKLWYLLCAAVATAQSFLLGRSLELRVLRTASGSSPTPLPTLAYGPELLRLPDPAAREHHPPRGALSS